MRLNPIKNPSFETNTTGYTFQGASTTQTRDTGEFMFGSASMKCVNTGSGRTAVYGATGSAVANADSIPVVGVRPLITFSAYIKWTTTPTTTYAKIHWFNAAGAWISDSDGTTSFTPTINTWTRLTVTGQAPANAVTYGLALFHTGSGTYYTDGWLAERSPIAGPYFDGSTTGVTGYTHSWDGTANASSSRAVASGTRTNLVTNPSVETNTTGWTGNTTVGRVRTSSQWAVAGEYYMNAVDWVESSKVSATAGLDYTGSGYYSRASAARNGTVTVHFYDVSNAELSPPTVTQTAILTQDIPQRFASSRVAPAGTTQVAVRCTGTSTVALDAILLEQSPYLDDYFDGGTKSTTLTRAWAGTAHASTSTEVAGAPTDGTLVTVKSREAGAWVSRVAVPRARVNGIWKVCNPKRWNGSAWVDLA